MKTIYLVLPCYNEELVLNDSIDKLKILMCSLMEKNKISNKSKIVFVDDGSTDNTWTILSNACNKDKLLGAISLAHNRGHQNALLAGMMTVKDKCDAVITLDADLQHDINVIPEFIDKYEQGYEIVYGVRKMRKGGFFKKYTGSLFYDLMRVAGADVIKNHADYRLMSSKALNALSNYEEVNLFLRGIVSQMGFKNTVLEYDEKPRLAGESKYSLKKMLKLAMDGITSFSIRPLQMISMCGVVFLVISVIMLLYSLITYMNGGAVSGWTSTVGALWLIGGAQLFALGIVGEYVGKIYMETKHRPRYEIDKIIMDESEVL